MDIIKRQTRLFVLALFTLSTLSLAACETMEGAGKDMEKGGQAIQKKANEG